MQELKISVLQDLKISTLRDIKISTLQNLKISSLQDLKVSDQVRAEVAWPSGAKCGTPSVSCLQLTRTRFQGEALTRTYLHF